MSTVPTGLTENLWLLGGFEICDVTVDVELSGTKLIAGIGLCSCCGLVYRDCAGLATHFIDVVGSTRGGGKPPVGIY